MPLPPTSPPHRSPAQARGRHSTSRGSCSSIWSTIRTRRCWTAEGTAVFADISGFTKLSERLARKGREGAEQITEAIGGSFESILTVAYENGGSLLKFGGDALLLWFEGEGHARARLPRDGPDAPRRCATSAGSSCPARRSRCGCRRACTPGRFHFFAVGTSHLELLPTGPAWSRLVAMETRGRRRRDPRQPGDGRAPARPTAWAMPRAPGVLLLREPARPRRTSCRCMPRPKIAAGAARALPVAGGPRPRARRRRQPPSTVPSRSRSSTSRAPTR